MFNMSFLRYEYFVRGTIIHKKIRQSSICHPYGIYLIYVFILPIFSPYRDNCELIYMNMFLKINDRDKNKI